MKSYLRTASPSASERFDGLADVKKIALCRADLELRDERFELGQQTLQKNMDHFFFAGFSAFLDEDLGAIVDESAEIANFEPLALLIRAVKIVVGSAEVGA